MCQWYLPPMTLSVLGNLFSFGHAYPRERVRDYFNKNLSTKLSNLLPQQHGSNWSLKGRWSQGWAPGSLQNILSVAGIPAHRKVIHLQRESSSGRAPRPSVARMHIQRAFRPRALCHPKAGRSSAWVKGATGKSAQKRGRHGKAHFPTKRMVGG